MSLHDELAKLLGNHAAELANHDGVPVQPVHVHGAANNVAALLTQVRDTLLRVASAVGTVVANELHALEGDLAGDDTATEPVAASPEPVAAPVATDAPAVASEPVAAPEPAPATLSADPAPVAP